MECNVRQKITVLNPLFLLTITMKREGGTDRCVAWLGIADLVLSPFDVTGQLIKLNITCSFRALRQGSDLNVLNVEGCGGAPQVRCRESQRQHCLPDAQWCD